MFIIFISIIILSYVLMHGVEIASFGTRVAGRVSNRVALGTTLQLTIYTTSRFLLIPFLPSLLLDWNKYKVFIRLFDFK